MTKLLVSPWAAPSTGRLPDLRPRDLPFARDRPPDRDARDPLSATPPLVIAEWPAKPRQMLAGTFVDAKAAAEWLEQQLAETPPMPTALPAETVLEYARARLDGHPGDVVTRYYTASSYACRDLVRCTGRCPQPPD